jgi:hypothetical protein
MSSPILCDPFQVFLRGDSQETGFDGNGRTYSRSTRAFSHHETAESFQLALDLGCVLCLHLWARLVRETEYALQNKFSLSKSPIMGSN